MSDEITWVRCPRCGEQAAVGWTTVMRDDGEPLARFPVEFDCVHGCEISRLELVDSAFEM